MTISLPAGSKIYLSGPISGILECNRPAFEETAWKLRQMGYEVVSPPELNDQHPENIKYSQFMRCDFGELSTCDAIFMMPGWWRSPGARSELNQACMQACMVIFDEGC